jgi:hypothetical protein
MEVSRLSTVVTDWGVAVLWLFLAGIHLGYSGLSGVVLLVHRLVVLMWGALWGSSFADIHWYQHVIEATWRVGQVVLSGGRASLLLLSSALSLLEVLPQRPLGARPLLLFLLC